MVKNNLNEKLNPSGKNIRMRRYFDWAASAPAVSAPAASAPFSPSSDNAQALFGNPSSQHCEGKAAKAAIEDVRIRCAEVLKVPPETLYFTSGGTESNSIALFSNLMKKSKGRVLASTAEHASVREGMETIEKMGRPTGKISVDASGRVTEKTLEKALEKFPDTRFVSIMSVNNETGAVTDIALLKNVIRKKTENSSPVHFHCDLVQAIGKIPVDINNWEIDSASISAHKIGGPRGIGLLYLRKPFEVFYSGGGQEKGIRGGTENIIGASVLADCLEKFAKNKEHITDNKEQVIISVEDYFSQAAARWYKLMNAFSSIDRCTFIPADRFSNENNSSLIKFSPYILQVAFKDIPGEVMARALDDLGFAVSTGSACSSSSPERPVLAAMGVEEKLRIEGIRISQGYTTTDEDIDMLTGAITEVLKFL